MRKQVEGIFLGLLSASLFGLIPLFAVSLEKEYEMGQPSILFYRFLLATVFLLFLCWKKVRVKVKKKEKVNEVIIKLGLLFILSIFYATTSLGLLWSYFYIPVGTAITIHFLYPALVAIILIPFSHKKGKELKYLLIATFLSFVGVFLLCWTGKGVLNLPGILWAFLTVVTYALYMIGLGLDKQGFKKFNMEGIDSLARTFYIMLFCTILFGVYALLTGGIEPIDNLGKWINLIVMAILSTALADYWLIIAQDKTDSTKVSILGVMEPVVGVCVGVCFFNEILTNYSILGILLALFSIGIVIFLEPKKNHR